VEWPAQAPSPEALCRFVAEAARQRRHLLGRGYQAAIYLWGSGDFRLVIKAATGWWPLRLVRQWMLHREYRAYRLLEGVAGVPRCYGLLAGRYLVLEFVPGQPRHEAAIADRPAFFAELFATIQEMHRRGVAHGDIQKRDNLLVVEGRHPCILDFGAAVVRKEGFAPLNHWLFRFLSRLDCNTWVKLKSGGRVAEASEADLAYYHRTWLERAARAVKRVYTAPRRWWRRRATRL
jgi:predicted Ser/Thr protein kinase